MKTDRIWWPTATAFLLLLAGCTRTSESGRVVAFDLTDVEADEVATIPLFWSGQEEGKRSTAWLGPWTYLGSGGAPPFVPLPGDTGTLHLGFNDWSARLSGLVVGLKLDDEDGIAWFEQAPTQELAQLRTISLSDSLTPEIQLLLEQLSGVNPNANLALEGSVDAAWLLKRFRPWSLWLPGSAKLTPDQLTDQQQLQQLFLEGDGVLPLEIARLFPNLRHLWIGEGEIARPLVVPASLEELTFLDASVDIRHLGEMPRLRALRFTASEWSNGSDLAAWKQLRWLGLPMNATQLEFAAIIRAHPDLEVLEVIGADSVTDLSPLRGARRLRAVTLDGEFANLGVLREIPTLEFVGFSKEMMEKSPDEVAAIRAALPAAAVVQVTGFCLGSGWILLLVPTVLLMMLTRPARRAA